MPPIAEAPRSPRRECPILNCDCPSSDSTRNPRAPAFNNPEPTMMLSWLVRSFGQAFAEQLIRPNVVGQSLGHRWRHLQRHSESHWASDETTACRQAIDSACRIGYVSGWQASAGATPSCLRGRSTLSGVHQGSGGLLLGSLMMPMSCNIRRTPSVVSAQKPVTVFLATSLNCSSSLTCP